MKKKLDLKVLRAVKGGILGIRHLYVVIILIDYKSLGTF